MKATKFVPLIVLAWHAATPAMTFYTAKLTCPFDGTKIEAGLEGSGTSFDATLDFQQTGAISTPWPLAECPNDGFVFFKDKFSAAEIAKLRPLVRSPEFRALRSAPSYYRAFWLRDRIGDDHWVVTWTLVQAIWQDHRYVAEVVGRLPTDISQSGSDEQVNRRLLYGEFLRQLGRFDESRQVFTTVLGGLDDRFSPTGVFARYELYLLKAKDTSSRHMRSEAETAVKDDPEYKKASNVPTIAEATGLTQKAVFLSDKPDINARLLWSSNGRTLLDIGSNGILSMEPASVNAPLVGTFLPYAGCLPIETDTCRDPKSRLATLKSIQASVPFSDGDLVGDLTTYDNKSYFVDDFQHVELRDIETGKLTRMLRDPLNRARRPLMGRAFLSADPTGPRVVVYAMAMRGAASEVGIWDYVKNKKVLDLGPVNSEGRNPEAAAYTANGSQLFVMTHMTRMQPEPRVDTCEVRRWNMQTAKVDAEQTSNGYCPSMYISADGKYVLLAAGQSATLLSGDLTTVVATMKLQGNGRFQNAAFDIQSKRLAVLTGEAIVVYAIDN